MRGNLADRVDDRGNFHGALTQAFDLLGARLHVLADAIHALDDVLHGLGTLLGRLARAIGRLGGAIRVVGHRFNVRRHFLHGGGRIDNFTRLLHRTLGELFGRGLNFGGGGSHAIGGGLHFLQQIADVFQHQVHRVTHVAQRTVGHLGANRQVAVRSIRSHHQQLLDTFLQAFVIVRVFLGFHAGVDHFVELLGQLANFVLGDDLGARGVIALGDAVGGGRQQVQRMGNTAGEPGADEEGHNG